MSRRNFLTGQFLSGFFVKSNEIEGAQDMDSCEIPDRPLPKNPQIAADATPAPGTQESTNKKMKLPDLNQAILDQETLDQFFRDVQECTQLLEIIPKRGPKFSENINITLDQAKNFLKNKSVRGLQLRYKYEGSEWWDTLIVMETGVKLVRIRHDFEM